MSRVKEYIKRVDEAIAKANAGQTKLTIKQLSMDGMSSNANRIFLNELIKKGDRYLEIGVWKGSTFVAANYENEAAYKIAIDNFSQFEGARNTFFNVCNDNAIKDYVFINNDCFNLLPEEKSFIKDINVYFYDGDHTAKDQELALSYYYETLADEFIFIVDDWNHSPAREGTDLGFKTTNLKIHDVWEIRTEVNGQKDSWWNGFGIFVCSKRDKV